MPIWCVGLIFLLIVLCIAILLRYIIYRRQVEKLCRLVAFMNDNRTQMQPDVDINARELNELVAQIRRMNDRLKENELSHMRQDEALRETIANLSHDIRTPLTSLDGYFQLLLAPEISQDKKEYYTGIIKSRIASLTEMLDELFTYARLQDPNYEIETDVLDITPVTAETVISFYDEIRKNGTEPVIELPEEPLMIKADRGAYVRIVQNIVRNALVHGKSLNVKLADEGGKAVFTCSDEILSSEESVDISRVFDRFYKADHARGSKGSGLGLSISKELTEKMGGRIEAECADRLFIIRVIFDCVTAEKNDISFFYKSD